MRKVQAGKHDITYINYLMGDGCGGAFWARHCVMDGAVFIRQACGENAGKPFPEFWEVFGRIGYRSIQMETIYYRAAHHAARM